MGGTSQQAGAPVFDRGLFLIPVASGDYPAPMPVTDVSTLYTLVPAVR
jgi:hypothetical protein